MNEQDQIIDLKIFVRIFLKHIVPILLAAALAAAAGYSLARFVIPKRYTSKALMYVENSSGKNDEATINSADLTAAQKLVNTCQILFTSNKVLKQLSDEMGGKYSPGTLGGMISINPVNSTEVLSVTVTSLDKDDAQKIADLLINLSIKEFKDVLTGGNIYNFDPPVEAKLTYPSTSRFAVIGGLIGFALCYLVFFIVELLDNKVKPDDDLSQMYEIPVFAEILDFETASKGGKYGKYGYSKYGYSRDSYGSYDSDMQEEEKIYSDEEEEEEPESEEKNSKEGKLKNA